MKRATLYAAVAVLMGVGLIPICLMIASSLWADGAVSVKNYVEILGNTRTWILFRNSLVLSALTTAAAGIGGVMLGILVTKTDLPMGKTLAAVFSLPLLFPPYILAVGWFQILGSGLPFGLPGAVLVLGPAFLPIVLLLTITSLRGVNPALEEAGRLSCGWPGVLTQITIPLIKPGILLSLVLVFLLTMGEFGAPLFLRLNVFPVASFTQSSAFYNFGAATTAAMPLIAVVFAGVLLQQHALHKRTFSFRWGGQQTLGRIPLGRKTPLVLLAVVSLAVVTVGLPLAGVLWRGSSLTALHEAFQRAGGSAMRSFLYAGIAASVLSLLGFFLGYLVHRRALRGWWLVDAAALFLFTTPGTVLAIGLIALWNHPSSNWVYATPAIVIFGFVAQYAALSIRIFVAGFSQTSPSLEEAAEVAGAGWFRRVFGVLMPLAKSAMLTSWTVTFVFCLRDSALPLLLAPPGADDLTARTLTLMANGSAELIAALCVIAVLLALVPLGALGLGWRLWNKPA